MVHVQLLVLLTLLILAKAWLPWWGTAIWIGFAMLNNMTLAMLLVPLVRPCVLRELTQAKVCSDSLRCAISCCVRPTPSGCSVATLLRRHSARPLCCSTQPSRNISADRSCLYHNVMCRPPLDYKRSRVAPTCFVDGG